MSKFWLPVLFIMALIFYLSSLSGESIPSLFINQDIFLHAAIYSLLAFFFARAVKNSFLGIPAAKLIFYAVVFGIVYGATDEFHQVFVPLREPSAFDVFIDGLGSFLGSMLYGKNKTF